MGSIAQRPTFVSKCVLISHLRLWGHQADQSVPFTKKRETLPKINVGESHRVASQGGWKLERPALPVLTMEELVGRFIIGDSTGLAVPVDPLALSGSHRDNAEQHRLRQS